MEAMADATTIVFDKTGTLTKAKPVVSDVVSFSEELSADELLRIAACMEEHFLIPWQEQLSMQPNRNILFMRKCTQSRIYRSSWYFYNY